MDDTKLITVITDKQCTHTATVMSSNVSSLQRHFHFGFFFYCTEFVTISCDMISSQVCLLQPITCHLHHVVVKRSDVTKLIVEGTKVQMGSSILQDKQKTQVERSNRKSDEDALKQKQLMSGPNVLQGHGLHFCPRWSR